MQAFQERLKGFEPSTSAWQAKPELLLKAQISLQNGNFR
jgi:hypothetical protein